MATVFTTTFGGSAVSPADVSYAAYSFSEDITLFWPAFSAGQTNVAARFMNMTAETDGLGVIMPAANLVSVGFDTIIFNAGSESFIVVSAEDDAICEITPGQTFYIILNDNSDVAGTWQTVQFGVGTGSADAAALQGAGLLAIANTLNVNTTATTVSGSYTITTNERGVLQVWTGGSGTISLPTASSVGNGFFFPFANNGSGSVTFSASDNIDGGTTSVYSQTQSGFIISSGSTWYSVGKGTQSNYIVSILNLNVAGNSDITETSAQAQNIIQQFTGVLTGNINVIVPSTVQIYYVFNDTSGAFTLTMKTAAGSGITIDQGTHVILYCDGTNVVNAFTSTFGGAISIAAGSAGAPNFNIIGSTTTGIYSPAAGQLAVTAAGKEVMSWIANASAVNWAVVGATATGVPITFSANGGDTNIKINIIPKNSGTTLLGTAGAANGSLELSGSTSGTTVLKATAAASGTLTLPAATDTLVGKATTDTLTNKSISGSTNTITNVSLASGVIGNLPVTNLNSGTSASAATFWRGDGTWSVPAGAGDVAGPASSTDNAIVRFDLTTGKIIQNSAVTIADTTGIIAGTQGVTFSGSSSGTTALVPATAASGTLTLPAATDTLVGKATTDTLTNKSIALSQLTSGTLASSVGASATTYDIGTVTTGTTTPASTNGNFQKMVNGGASTLAPPSTITTISLQVTNNGSAGAITTSGFTKVIGSFDTTNGHIFQCTLTKTADASSLVIAGMF